MPPTLRGQSLHSSADAGRTRKNLFAWNGRVDDDSPANDIVLRFATKSGPSKANKGTPFLTVEAAEVAFKVNILEFASVKAYVMF